MKNLKTLKAAQRAAGLTALIAVIIFTLGSCVINVPGDDNGGTPTYYLDGVWKSLTTNGVEADLVTVSGTNGTVTSFKNNSFYPIIQSAINKRYINVGSVCWRNLKRTSNNTWSGEWSGIRYSNNVAQDIRWYDGAVWTLTENGQRLLIGEADLSGGSTWIRQ
jgi:hypothetical protein